MLQDATIEITASHLKIIALADIHNNGVAGNLYAGFHRVIQQKNMPSADLVICGGDLIHDPVWQDPKIPFEKRPTHYKTEADFIASIAWLYELNPKHWKRVIWIGGNHDGQLQHKRFEITSALRKHFGLPHTCLNAASCPISCLSFRNVTYLQDSPFHLTTRYKCQDRVWKIFGSPKSIRGGTAGFTNERKDKEPNAWNALRQNLNTEILLTHGPAMGHLDTDITQCKRTPGDEILRDIKEQEMPHLRLHVFGHVHNAAGHNYTSYGHNRQILDCNIAGIIQYNHPDFKATPHSQAVTNKPCTEHKRLRNWRMIHIDMNTKLLARYIPFDAKVIAEEQALHKRSICSTDPPMTPLWTRDVKHLIPQGSIRTMTRSSDPNLYYRWESGKEGHTDVISIHPIPGSTILQKSGCARILKFVRTPSAKEIESKYNLLEYPNQHHFENAIGALVDVRQPDRPVAYFSSEAAYTGGFRTFIPLPSTDKDLEAALVHFALVWEQRVSARCRIHTLLDNIVPTQDKDSAVPQHPDEHHYNALCHRFSVKAVPVDGRGNPLRQALRPEDIVVRPQDFVLEVKGRKSQLLDICTQYAFEEPAWLHFRNNRLSFKMQNGVCTVSEFEIRQSHLSHNLVKQVMLFVLLALSEAEIKLQNPEANPRPSIRIVDTSTGTEFSRASLMGSLAEA